MQATRAGQLTLSDRLDRALRRVTLWLVLAAALYLTLALVSFSPHDLGWSYVGPEAVITNWGGAFGAWFADLALFTLGSLAYALPLLLVWSGALLFIPQEAEPETRLLTLAWCWLGGILSIAAGAILLGLYLGDWGRQWLPNGIGGGLGVYGAQWARTALGESGALGLVTGLSALGALLLSGRAPWVLITGVAELLHWGWLKFGSWAFIVPRRRRRRLRVRPEDCIDREWIVATIAATEQARSLARAGTAGRLRRMPQTARASSPPVKHPPPLHLLAIARPRGEAIALRGLLETVEYRQAHAPLALALGRDADEQAVIVDLAQLPHLLVTGRDDPTLLHALVIGLVYRARARDARLLLIDSKAQPLTVYDGLPHLLAPIVTDFDQAVTALRWCVSEMARRYRLLDRISAADLASYNRQVMLPSPRSAKVAGSAELPVIVVAIAELAELITAFGNPAIEEPLAHLARRGARVGLHLLLFTRRTADEILHDAIQADVPARLLRDPLDPVHARYLADPAATELWLEAVGADERDARHVVAYLRQAGQPSYLADLAASAEIGDGGADYLFDEAVRIVIEQRDSSIVGLQRALGIGYKRAARLIDAMQRHGILGPPSRDGAREVLVTTEQLKSA